MINMENQNRYHSTSSEPNHHPWTIIVASSAPPPQHPHHCCRKTPTQPTIHYPCHCTGTTACAAHSPTPGSHSPRATYSRSAAVEMRGVWESTGGRISAPALLCNTCAYVRMKAREMRMKATDSSHIYHCVVQNLEFLYCTSVCRRSVCSLSSRNSMIITRWKFLNSVCHIETISYALATPWRGVVCSLHTMSTKHGNHSLALWPTTFTSPLHQNGASKAMRSIALELFGLSCRSVIRE